MLQMYATDDPAVFLSRAIEILPTQQHRQPRIEAVQRSSAQDGIESNIELEQRMFDWPGPASQYEA